MEAKAWGCMGVGMSPVSEWVGGVSAWRSVAIA